jgi:hypothetical protein
LSVFYDLQNDYKFGPFQTILTTIEIPLNVYSLI